MEKVLYVEPSISTVFMEPTPISWTWTAFNEAILVGGVSGAVAVGVTTAVFGTPAITVGLITGTIAGAVAGAVTYAVSAIVGD